MVFWTGGCSSCHAAKGAEGDAKLVLSGGLALKSPFGTFHVPNISRMTPQVLASGHLRSSATP